MNLKNKTIAIIGGSGSLGHALTEHLLKTDVKKIIIFSRGEVKQADMMKKYPDGRLRFLLGDVQNRNRLTRALQKVDYCLYVAAMKRIQAAEYNTLECVGVNVDGAVNVVNACIDSGVKKCVFTSTDKACLPSTTYGISKAMAEKIIINGNKYGKCIFSAVRYGNVTGSRGSIYHIFKEQLSNGTEVTITDNRMTRFFMLIEDSVKIIFHALKYSADGEIYIPKLKSYRVTDFAQAMGAETFKKIPMRENEKLHEVLISEHEKYLETSLFYLLNSEKGDAFPKEQYDSNGNFMTVEELRVNLLLLEI